MTPDEAVAKLDAIDPDGKNDDPEDSHLEADAILRDLVPVEVSEAYGRVVERAGAWWYG